MHRRLSACWGLSRATCPDLICTLSLSSPISRNTFLVNFDSSLIKSRHWRIQDEKNDLLVAALTYRGEAIRVSQGQQFQQNNANSGDHQRLKRESSVKPDLETQVDIVLRLLMLGSRYVRAQDIAPHFAACRRDPRAFNGSR